MSESERISSHQSERVGGLRSGQDYAFEVKLNYQGYLLEVEDAHFHLDSAVLLPDYSQLEPASDQSPDQNRITGLAILYACYRHAKEHPQQHALVVGHTDRSGSERYNQTLSELRARNVRCAIQGNRTGWVEVADEKHAVEDYQQILRWLAQLGWDCNPGPKDGKDGPKTRQGVRNFQEQYNQRFDRSILVDGIVGPEVWGAFFEVYMGKLKHLMGTDEEGMKEARQNVHFLDCPSIGCGEHFPITADRRKNYRDPVDRRVEILFFDPGEEPPLDCEAPEDTCEELYRGERYSFEPLPAEPFALPAGMVPVHIELAYIKPEEVREQRAWPEGSSVVIAYEDGMTQEKELGADGALQFHARERAFTLRFPDSASKYVAVSPPDSGESDELIEEDEVDTYHENGWRVFKLPSAPEGASTWALPHSDWTAKGASNFEGGTFRDMEAVDRIGSEATPVQLVLDPHWLFVRFEFFDRVYGHSHHNDKRVSIPPVLLDGYRHGEASSSPDTRSNWMVFADERERTCQALPWIVQRGPDGTERPKPDTNVLLRFETSPDTFVVSEDEQTRHLEKVTDSAKLEPGPERLKYYDMPATWESQHYFTRLAKGTGRTFEDLTYEQIVAKVADPENPVEPGPLVFSLDDMVLTDENLDPIGWVPSDRAAIFSHQFAKKGDSDLSYYGLYKPDTDNDQSYLTQEPDGAIARNYIADYPNWTRLVVAQGNLFGVFDQRLPDGDDHPTGARAAVRRVDAEDQASPGQFYPGDRPDVIENPFFAIQPFYEQRHDSYFNDDTDRGIGRFDMALIRCCDVAGEREIAINFQHFRFFFDFTLDDTPDRLKNNPDNRREFEETTCREIARRWNGPPPDTLYTLHSTYLYNWSPGMIIPEDPDNEHQADPNRPLRIRPFYFVETVPEVDIAHFKLDVKDECRASMGSHDGEGQLGGGPDDEDYKPDSDGGYTGAHETGHAASLGDEYIESSSSASYRAPGLKSFSPGSPYAPDDEGMMNGNKYVRARYLWHVAEWLRSLDGDRNYFIEKGTHKYTLPHHADAPEFCLVNWPLDERIDWERGAHGKFDAFLCPLGEDAYSQGGLVTGHNLDGLLMVVVKIKLIFESDSARKFRSAVHYALQKFHQRLNGTGSGGPGGKFYAEGEFGSAGSPQHRTFDKCAIRFSPRVLGETFPEDDEHAESYARKMGVREEKANPSPPPDKIFDYDASKDEYEDEVSDIEDTYEPHFEMDVSLDPSTNSRAWDPSNDYKATLTCKEEEWWHPDNFGQLFCDAFPRMLGIDEDIADVTVADLTPIAQAIVPGADVKTF